MPRAIRTVPRAPRAARFENGLHVAEVLGHALAGVRLIWDALLPALRGINIEEAR